MGRVSPPSSPESSDSVFAAETSKAPTSITLPPINMKNNTSFTEAELKAITPWRNALIQRLLENHARDQQQQQMPQQQQYQQLSRKTPEPPRVSPQNLNAFNLEAAQPPARLQMYHKQPQSGGGRPRQPRGGQGRGCAPGGGGPPFHDLGHMTELDLGQGQGYEGRIVRGTTAFTAVTGAIKQANQGTGTVRGVVETILKFVLPSDLAVYSLTGKSLQERFEVRNGQTQARVIMSESGSSKLCIPPQLVQGERKTYIIF